MVYTIVHRDENGKETIVGEEIRVGGKVISLRFTMTMWYRLENEICILDDLYTMMHEKGRFREDKLPALISMMSGEEITPKELLREADPATMRALIDKATEVIAKAVTMRERKYDDDSVHDETLEEIEKKEPRAD